jgi:SAM-dependent methyltransferase
MHPNVDELAGIKKFYEEQDRDRQYDRQWGYTNPMAAAYWRLRDEVVFQSVTKRFDPLGNPHLRVLEIGVGHGHELAKFAQLGIPQTNLVGVDLDADRLARAKAVYPAMAFAQQDARRLAFPNDSFDIVCQFTCVMHAQTGQSQATICREMARVLKPGGLIIWWDIAPARWRVRLSQKICGFFFPARGWKQRARSVLASLRNVFGGGRPKEERAKSTAPFILPVSLKELNVLFAGLKIRGRLAGLDYSLWSCVWPRSSTLAHFLWRRGWLSHHCFAVIEKE